MKEIVAFISLRMIPLPIFTFFGAKKGLPTVQQESVWNALVEVGIFWRWRGWDVCIEMGEILVEKRFYSSKFFHTNFEAFQLKHVCALSDSSYIVSVFFTMFRGPYVLKPGDFRGMCYPEALIVSWVASSTEKRLLETFLSVSWYKV